MQEVGARIRCVIGDDHAAVRRGVILFLERQERMEVVGEAEDGVSLLELLEQERPDVVILDLQMPELDGVGVCREVAARGLPTAIVAYTAFSEPRAIEEVLQAGARGFVLKASPPQDLVRAVTLAAAGQLYVDATVSADLLRLARSRQERELLTGREREVLQLLARGMTTESAAAELLISPTTVRSYADSAMHKLESRNRTEAVAKALRLAIIE